MKDCIALIGARGFFEIFEPAPVQEENTYYHFPADVYHWSDRQPHGAGSILYLHNGWPLTMTGARITKDETMRNLVRTVERL